MIVCFPLLYYLFNPSEHRVSRMKSYVALTAGLIFKLCLGLGYEIESFEQIFFYVSRRVNRSIALEKWHL